MKLTYFGTAAAEGWPALFCNCEACTLARQNKGRDVRTRSQALVNDDLLLDFPPDTYYHVLQYGLDLNRVTDVLITHTHEDHLYIEDFACRSTSYTRHAAPHRLKIYGSEAVAARYDWCCAIPWNKPLAQAVEMRRIEAYMPFETGRYTIHPLEANHNKLEACLIYAIEDNRDGKTLLYAHDTGFPPAGVLDYCKQRRLRFDLVSLDCTFGGLSYYDGHMGLPACRELKARLIKEGLTAQPCVFIVNHFSHNGDLPSHAALETAARPDGFVVAYDGLTVSV